MGIPTNLPPQRQYHILISFFNCSRKLPDTFTTPQPSPPLSTRPATFNRLQANEPSLAHTGQAQPQQSNHHPGKLLLSSATIRTFLPPHGHPNQPSQAPRHHAKIGRNQPRNPTAESPPDAHPSQPATSLAAPSPHPALPTKEAPPGEGNSKKPDNVTDETPPSTSQSPTPHPTVYKKATIIKNPPTTSAKGKQKLIEESDQELDKASNKDDETNEDANDKPDTLAPAKKGRPRKEILRDAAKCMKKF
ncbi:hypothetical protein PtB15_17B216 [Puccinia triticina]|nr:hypothetical protein PtB15_17B216 [Puccinia triticina]